MRILVTGGAGFIGSHVVESYQRDGHEVAVLDDLSSGKRENLASGTPLFEGKIEDLEFVQKTFKEFRPDVVNHHAAQVSVVVSTKNIPVDASINILGTITLLEAIKDTPSIKKLIYATSGGAMYGNPIELPCREEHPANPVSPYGLSKYTAERYVWMYRDLHGLKATVLRYSNVFGPRQDPHGEAGVCAIFTGKMLNNEPVTIFGDGSQVRDYVYIEDVARANQKALTLGNGESYNVATGVGTSTLQVYEELKNASGYSQSAIIGPGRAGEVQAVILSAEKAKQELDWVSETTFTEGIEKTITWYRNKE